MILKNNKGSMFITVVMVLSVLLIMLSLLLSVSSTGVRTARTYTDGIKTYVMAESMVNEAIAYLVQNKPKADVSLKTGTVTGLPGSSEYTIHWNALYMGPAGTDKWKYTISCNTVYKSKYARKLVVDVEIDAWDHVDIKRWKQVNPD